jgi:peptide deformylase
MSILPIVKYGDPVLRLKAKPVERIRPEIQQLVSDMFETLYDAPGVGLAAPQVGVPLQLVVIDIRPKERRHPLVLINPRIIEKSGKDEEEEGCLSLPGLNAKVKRYKTVRVEAVNERGFPFSIEADAEAGLLSRALQHEIDHLDGKLYVDYLTRAGKKKLEDEIKKRKKQGDW